MGGTGGRIDLTSSEKLWLWNLINIFRLSIELI